MHHMTHPKTARNPHGGGRPRTSTKRGKLCHETKRCGVCLQDKSCDEFPHAGTEGRGYACNDCNVQNVRRYQAEKRQFVLEYLLDHPCVDCGVTNPIVLDFDHVTGEKIGNVSEMIKSGSLRGIKEEIKKCEVRCANCHRIVTHERSHATPTLPSSHKGSATAF